MKTRVILYADEGMILTDGNIYATEVYLAEGVEPSAFREITKEEHIVTETEMDMNLPEENDGE